MTISKFEDLGISREVLRGIRSAGWTEPTPIQAAAVPIGLEGSDLLAQAQTGTGKTGTYGSIILSMKESGMSVPSALVLVPTRELAIQVTDELGVLAQYSGHTALAVYGGVNIESQVKKLKKASGYEVLTGLKNKAAKMKVKSFKGAKKTKLKVKGLKKGKKYFVRSRPYKTYKGHKYIGILNGAKKAKVK